MKLKTEKRIIQTDAGNMKLLVLRPKNADTLVPGILWIHGGGYVLGMASMVQFSQGKMLAKKYGAVVISPEYRLAKNAPYPAAFNDCYAALKYLYDHADELGVDRNKIVVGGESAGGGLAAAVCLYARDHDKIPICFQIPLYPMLDCEDTDSSRDNHGQVWDTRKNHWGWKLYLGELYGTNDVPKYASPSRETDFTGMPPCYTFVMDGEPFHDETQAYIRKLCEVGVEASLDVYHGDIHAFDALVWTDNAKEARRKLCAAYEKFVVKKNKGSYEYEQQR